MGKQIGGDSNAELLLAQSRSAVVLHLLTLGFLHLIPIFQFRGIDIDTSNSQISAQVLSEPVAASGGRFHDVRLEQVFIVERIRQCSASCPAGRCH